MFGWLRRGPTRPGTALAMIGPRSSDHVLVLGASGAAVAAESGAVTRLNGRTVLVGHGADAATRTEQAAAKAGAIVEFIETPPATATLPFGAATFHIVVIADLAVGSTDAGPTLADATRVLQPGGRIILIFGEPARGMFAALKPAPPPEKEAVLNLLVRAGLVAGRLLAMSEGVAYFEARKAR